MRFDLNSVGCSIQFCVILSYLPPCNLASFLKDTAAPTQKGVFPYQHYNSVHDIRNATEFPQLEAFYSDMKGGLSCTESEYLEAKELFENRMSLPENHPNRWHSMMDFLEYYNNSDTLPLIHAIRSWFSTFENVFGVDGFQKQSLASMAQSSMVSQFCEYSPLLHSLPPWKSDLLKKVRENLVGGLVTCLHRSVLMDGSEGPDSAKFVPNGDPFSCVVPWDFNS